MGKPYSCNWEEELVRIRTAGANCLVYIFVKGLLLGFVGTVGG
jgi:hypothetical protein